MLSFFTRTHYSFEGKRRDEKVLVFLHRHPLVLFVKYAILLLLSLAPIFVWQYIKDLSSAVPIKNIEYFCLVVYYTMLWVIFIYQTTMYLLDSWIVTNERILNNVQNGFFKRTVSELQLRRVQDISVSIDGLLPTFFNFGHVEIQSAGAVNKFVFEEVPKPHLVKDQIMKLVRNNSL